MTSSIWHRISRTKQVDTAGGGTHLKRCLTTLDLTLLAMGAMVGSGIYVTTGVSAKELAGPSIVLSFLAASVVISLAAACFAEFATRFHRTGSSYLYIYISIGELPAFVMGWSILACILASGAISARAWSAYLDNLLNGAVANFTKTHIAEWTVGPPISRYPDFIGCVLVIVLTIVLSLGARVSATFNNCIVAVNVLVLVFVSIVGFVYADLDNWTSEETGGFMPFGWSGVVVGAGACFYALTGFEIVSMAAEETITPRRSVPIATATVVAFASVLYMTMSAAITLITPYTDLDVDAPLPSAFQLRGITWAQYIAAIGPLFGLFAMEINSIYGGVRVMYAMAEDGLLPAVLCAVHVKTRVPIVTTVLFGFITCVLTLFLELEDLLGFAIVIEMGQYMCVAIAVIILRYRRDGEDEQQSGKSERYCYGAVDSSFSREPAGQGVAGEDGSNHSSAVSHQEKESPSAGVDNGMVDSTESTALIGSTSEQVHLRGPFVFMKGYFEPFSGRWVPIATCLLFIVVLLLAFTLVYELEQLTAGVWWAILLVCLLVICTLLLGFSIAVHQQSSGQLTFEVPFVPLLPTLSIFASSVLLVSTATATSWIGVVAIVLLALLVYFVYAIRHSKLNESSISSTESKNDEVTSLLGTDNTRNDTQSC